MTTIQSNASKQFLESKLADLEAVYDCQQKLLDAVCDAIWSIWASSFAPAMLVEAIASNVEGFQTMVKDLFVPEVAVDKLAGVKAGEPLQARLDMLNQLSNALKVIGIRIQSSSHKLCFWPKFDCRASR